ncbi:MAG TPA: redoxin domain-containing protein [Steroidobacteraceae bacterium]|nr:redoxin domain-containing protein [Steroidobacteraceae bacterium]
MDSSAALAEATPNGDASTRVLVPWALWRGRDRINEARWFGPEVRLHQALRMWQLKGMKKSWNALALLCVASVATAVAAEPRPAKGGDMSMPVAAAAGWLNSGPQTAADLRGKVVVVQFWTYTCINWRRTLPYIRAWDEKYREQGLVVIGVHTPEFDFEENVDNVRSALGEMHINYPVAIDNQRVIWTAFHNVYWPALYLLDAKGQVRYRQFGEGEYARTEREIQKLLTEAGGHPSSHLAEVAPLGAEVPADVANLRSPESYVGYEMAERFASKGGTVPNRRHEYVAANHVSLNEWALSGSWTMARQAAVLDAVNGKIVYRFHARDLNLVMAPSVLGTPVRFRVLIDGHSPGPASGADIDEEGYGSVSEARMYQLIRQPGRIADQECVIEFFSSGVSVYDFTFG